MTLTLMCPGALIAPVNPEDAAARAPWLARGLRRLVQVRSAPSENRGGHGDQVSTLHPVVAGIRETPEEAWLRQFFKVPASARIGAFAAWETSQPENQALVVRPVHLHVGLDHLVLSSPDELQLSPAESEALFEAANEWLRDEGLSFSAMTHPFQRVVLSDEKQQPLADLDAAGSRVAIGRNIDAWMVRGTAARPWRRLMNEVQMLWHTHPVNIAREARGVPVINGLWLEGSLRRLPASPLNRLVSSAPCWLGLGRAAGLQESQLVEADVAQMMPLLARIAPHEQTLAIVDVWHPALLAGDTASWLDAWAHLDRLVETLSRVHGLRGIRLIATGDQAWTELQCSALARWVPPLRASLIAAFNGRS